MTPTPEMLAAADAIDVKRYEGHTPWPIQIVVVIRGQSLFIERQANEKNLRQDAELTIDAPLIPALVFQRDEARAEVERLRAAIDKAVDMLGDVSTVSDVASVSELLEAAIAALEAKP